MTDVKYWSDQSWVTRANWDEMKAKIKEKWDDDLYISDLMWSGDRWMVIFSK